MAEKPRLYPTSSYSRIGIDKVATYSKQQFSKPLSASAVSKARKQEARDIMIVTYWSILPWYSMIFDKNKDSVIRQSLKFCVLSLIDMKKLQKSCGVH